MRVTRVWRSAACLAAMASSLPAQLPQTRLRAVFPPSAQVGSSVEFKLTSGEDLEEIAALHFSHPGITAAPKTQEVDGKPQPVDNTFTVTVAGDVPPGVYEVRASGLWGVSNPHRFAVSARKHIADTEPNNAPEQAQPIEVGASVFGKMEGGTDVDCFKFTAQAGQRVVIDCLAERLDSPLEPKLIVRNAEGRRLAWLHKTIGDDPTLVFDVPAAGDYVLEVHDLTYRNGQEYVYRLDLHTGPHIAFVMPPAGPAATKSSFTLYGYNLPGGAKTETLLNRAPLEQLAVQIDVPREEAVLDIQNLVRSYEADVDAFSWSLDTPQGRSNPVRIGISERAAVLETEPNDQPAQAQAVTAPAEVAGQFLQQGDMDWVAFPGKPGEVYWIEVIGQRTGSELDPVLVVEEVTKDANGAEQVKRLTQQDDDGANIAQNMFDTFTDDPVYRLSVGQEATYRVAVYDRYGQTRGGPALRYRLCIRGEEPDFRVVAVPAQSMNNTGVPWPVGLRKGDSVGVDVYALRMYGYEGPIDITVEGLPAGVHCAGTTIGSKETSGQLVFRSDENAPESVAMIRMIARAAIEHPAARRAFDAAQTRLAETEKPLPELRKKLAEADGKLQQGIAQRDAAAVKAAEDPANAGLAQGLSQAESALTSLKQQYDQAADALAAGEKALADARIALEKAEAGLSVSTRHRRHIVRTGALILKPDNNATPEGRLAQSFALAVLKEPAPFQVVAEPQRVVACQSRQILVPVKLVKRNGFDDKVQLTVAGIPKNSNLQAQNVAIEKGQSEALVSILVKENTPPGAYALWINSQAQVSYSRNPEKTARITAERDAVAEQLKQAQAASQQATEGKNQATAKATETNAQLQQAQQGKTQADQLLQQRTNELAQVKPQQEAAEKKVAETAAAVQAAETALQAAKAALDADKENADLQAKAAAAEAALAEAQKGAAAAAAARDELLKKIADAERLVQEATTGQQQAADVMAKAEAARTEAEAAKTAAEAAEKAAQEAAKRLEEQKKAQDKRVEEAEKQSKPQNKNFSPPTPPIVITVVPAPVKLNVNVPNGGAIKPGASLEIGVKVERFSGFTGPVALSLVLPPGASGVSGTAAIPAEATEGKLTITAAGDAPEAQLAHVVVRASIPGDGDGELLVDAPITLKVAK